MDSYQSWSVVYGEQPSASKWGILGTNDARFDEITTYGWIDPGETWTYASADAPTYTFIISGDKTSKYCAGDRIKLTQTTVKYFIITKVAYSSPNTTITCYGGTDYVLANATITSNYYSKAKSPVGFPLDPDKWTVKTADSTNVSQASPTADVWYNLGSISIDIPIGVWNVEYEVNHEAVDASVTAVGELLSTLSTANNSESDGEMTVSSYLGGASGTLILWQSAYRRKIINLASKATYYLNCKITSTGVSTIYHRGDRGTTIIRAVCAYL